jgi:hypothetical protein
MGQLVGGHTYSDQAKSLQLADSDGQGGHYWHLGLHQFFNPRRIIFRKAANEGEGWARDFHCKTIACANP